MKKFLYSVLALGAVATLASCSSEEPLGPGANDGKVTFNICLDDVKTRAFGETTNCNEIYYTVFDMDGNLVLADQHKTAFGPGVNTTTVELQLVANQDYQVIFYAHNSGSEFSKYENGVITVDYTKMNVNSTLDDAFINKSKYTPAGGAEVENQIFTADGNAKTVYLTRPFAQVNFGTDDLDNTAVQKIISGVTTTFEVSKGLNNTYTVIGGKASGTPEYPVTASTTTAPADNQDFPVEPATYDNLLSVYLLVPQTQDMIDATYTINLAGKPAINDLNLSAMPVQGNYRTNVYGSLLTTQNAFNVVIEPNFGTPDYNVIDPVDPTENPDGSYSISEPAHLLGFAALVNAGNDFSGKTIKLEGDIDMSGIVFTPIGSYSSSSPKPFKGTFDGGNHTILNLKVNTNGCGGLFGYTQNGTFKDVTLSGADITGGQFTGSICGLSHKGSGYVTIHNVTVSNSKIKGTLTVGGLTALTQFGADIQECTISNCEISGTMYVGGLIGNPSNQQPNAGNHCVYTGNKVQGGSVTATLSGGPIQGRLPSGSSYLDPATNVASDVTISVRTLVEAK